MTAQPVRGPQLVMPLLRLGPPRLLQLDASVALAQWALRVRDAPEACLLLDPQARVGAMSPCGGELLGLDPLTAVGSLLRDLLPWVDFTTSGLPLPDPEAHSPALRALRTGSLTRGLVRLRQRGALRTYDVVGIPLSGGAGALAFFTAV
jgi:hypothetical protein